MKPEILQAAARLVPPPIPTKLLLPIAIACGIALGGCARGSGPVDGRRLLDEVARLGAERVIGPRLSVTSGYQPCSPGTAAAGTVPQIRCARRPFSSGRATKLAQRIEEAMQVGVDPRVMHAAALVNVLWGDSGGIWLHESISQLQAAARLSNDPAVLADLAAVHLLRAERMQAPRDLLEAVENAERALRQEPRNAAARYNRALALDGLGLDEQAAWAWGQYLMLDSQSGWAEEARRRQGTLTAARTTVSPRIECGRTVPEPAALAARAPQEALLLGWNCLLGAWGEAVLKGDAERAGERLGLAEALGAGLERRRGDATLADAVRAIRAVAGDQAATRALARAHQDYARGRSAYDSAQHDTAIARFGRAAAGGGASPCLRRWARLFWGASLVYKRDTLQVRAGRKLLEGVSAESDTLRHPALAGRARWSLSTTLFLGGEYQQAREGFRTAERLLRRAGEREHLGAVQYLQADVEFVLGDAGAAYTSMHRSLMTLRPYRESVWLHNLLAATAQAAVADGLTRAAMRVQDEDVAVAARGKQRFYAAEALFARARLLAAVGQVESAAADVEAGRRVVEALEPGDLRSWFEEDLHLSEASVLLRKDPALAAAAFDPVVDFFSRNPNPIRLVPALTRRAEARLALGNAEAAIADLDSTTRVLDRLRRDIGRAALQASLLDAARGVFDRLVMLSVAAGRPAEALAYLERGRASFSRPGRTRAGAPLRSLASPPGEVVVEHALIGDTLLIWTLVGSDVHLTRRVAKREQLLSLIERTRSSLELRSSDTADVRRGLEALYDQVVRPVRARLGAPGTPLVLIADGEIAGIPFAALYDAGRQRYLVQDYHLRFAGSLRDAYRSTTNKGVTGRALLVADPAFDPAEFPGLARLDGAAAEVGAIRAFYREPVVLAGPAAGREAVEKAMPGTEVVHYAGHAVFDDQRPEQSFLLLSHGGARGGGGRLTAGDVEALDLRGVRLVVLSACQTLRSRSGRSGGFAGFSGALLSAGAGGVVGSLWSVSDSLTRPMMVRFHDVYRASGKGAEALRVAQLDMLRSPDPALRSPATWAGFRYAGN